MGTGRRMRRVKRSEVFNRRDGEGNIKAGERTWRGVTMTSGRASVEEDSERFPGTMRPLRCDRFNATASRLTTSDWAGGFHVRVKASEREIT